MKIANTPSRSTLRQWDPSKTDLVEQIFLRLIEKYRNGELKDEIRASTLLNDEGDFKAFYHAAFLSNSLWSKGRFPDGWASFVEELNSRLSSSEIVLVNSRREVKGSEWLPNWERGVILGVAERYREGQLSRADATSLLKEEFGLSLAPHQIQHYLPSNLAPRLPIEKTKEKLARRIEKLKSILAVDLSIAACVQGQVFESFAGVVLRALDPEGSLEGQKFLKLPYQDFSGKPHYAVYADWVRGGESWEIKLRNSLENILESALPQAIALGHPQKVVYRHPCEEMMFMIDANVRVDDELESLNLLNEQTIGKRIGDFVDYIPIEKLLDALPHSEVFYAALGAIDTKLSTASTDQMWQWVDVLERISASPDQLEQRLAVFTQSILENRTFSKDSAVRIFGVGREGSESEAEGLSRRLDIILREQTSARDRLLLAVYNKAFGKDERRLTDEHVQSLDSLHEKVFTEAALDILAEMEAKKTQRMLKSRHAEPVDRTPATISAFEKMEKRRIADCVTDARELRKSYEKVLFSAMTKLQPRAALGSATRGERACSYQEIATFFGKNLKGTRWHNLPLLSNLNEINEEVSRARKQFGNMLFSYFSELRKESKDATKKADESWNIDPNTSRLYGILREMSSDLEESQRAISRIPLAAAAAEIDPKLFAKIASLPRRDQFLYFTYQTDFSLENEQSLVEIARSHLDVIEMCKSYFPGQGLSPFREVADLVRMGKEPLQTLLEMSDNLNLAANFLCNSSITGVLLEGKVLETVKAGGSLGALLALDFGQLRMTGEEAEQGAIPIPMPLRTEIYFSRASPLWDSTNIVAAIDEADMRLRIDRCHSWEKMISISNALIRGAKIDALEEGADQSRYILIDMKYMAPLPPSAFKPEHDLLILDALDLFKAGQHLLSCDLWSRRVAQARRLALIDKELGLLFLNEFKDKSPSILQPLDEYTHQVFIAANESDALYSSLIGRVNGSSTLAASF